MNSTRYSPVRTLIAVAVAASLFAGCASAPKPAGSEQVRAKLTALQGEPTLANAAPVALKDAEAAVVVAEMPQKDLVLAAHRVYIDALVARAESAEQKVAAGNARSDADAAMLAANASQQQAAELQRQLEILQARPTDRGLVLTLGDTLFATGRAEIK